MRWRVLKHEVFPPAVNMALDEAILEAHRGGLVPPTLRFYGWAPPAVSLGYNQALPPDIVTGIESRGFQVVRRPTGGRAVLHFGELTYSFVGTARTSGNTAGSESRAVTSPFLSSGIAQAYAEICRGLQLGLRLLGVEAELGKTHSPYRQQMDCFLSTTSADLHYRGRKLIGSAQLRRRNAVLQHGSLLLDQPQHLMPSLLFEDGERHSAVAQPRKANAALFHAGSSPVAPHASSLPATRHVNLFDITGPLPLDRIQKCLIQGFEEAFDVRFEPGSLCRYEIDRIATESALQVVIQPG